MRYIGYFSNDFLQAVLCFKISFSLFFAGLELTSLFYGEVEKAANVRFHGQQNEQQQVANGGKKPVPVYNHKDPKEWLIKRSQYNSMKME